MFQGRLVSGDYNAALLAFIKGSEAFRKATYHDDRGVPTIGYGYALVVFGKTSWSIRSTLDADFSGIHTFSGAEKASLSRIVSWLNKAVADNGTPAADIDIAAAQKELDQHAKGVLDFTIDQPQALSLFTPIVKENLKSAGLTTAAAAPELAGTHELIALASIAYNGPVNITINHVLKLLENGDRLTVWLDILTGMNRGTVDRKGIENRHVKEANEFGLYSQGDHPAANSVEEPIKVIRFLDAHASDLTTYMTGTLLSAKSVATFLADNYAPAQKALINLFAQGDGSFTDVKVAADDKGDRILLADGAKGGTLVVTGLGNDTFIDNTTKHFNNFVVVRGQHDTLVGGTSAALGDSAFFAGVDLNESIKLDATGHATDGARQFAYNAATHTMVVSAARAGDLTITHFASGDYGLTLLHDFKHTITFSEFAVGTTIARNYQSQGVVFGGPAIIATDGANDTSPVLSGTPQFTGAISGRFVVPETGARATVTEFALDAGFFNQMHSTKLSWFDASNKLIDFVTNNQQGIEHFDIISKTGIASWSISIIGQEDAGYAIDNLAFATPTAVPAPALVHDAPLI